MELLSKIGWRKKTATEIEKLKDRNILVLSERIEHLNILYHLLDAKKIKSTLLCQICKR